MYNTYTDYMCKEASYGPELAELHTEVSDCHRKLSQEGASDGAPSQDADDTKSQLEGIMRTYMERIPVLREKLRPGATARVDIAVKDIVRTLYADVTKEKPYDHTKLSGVRDLAKLCNDEETHQKAVEVLVGMAEQSHLVRLMEVLDSPLQTSTDVNKLIQVTKQTANITADFKNERIARQLPGVVQTLAKSLAVQCETAGVSADAVQPWMDMFALFAKDEGVAVALEMPLASAKVAFNNFSGVASMVMKLRSKCQEYKDAKRGGDHALLSKAITELKTAVKHAQALIARPPVISIAALQPPATEVLETGKLLVEGSAGEGGDEIVGLVHVLERGAKEVQHMSLGVLRSKMEELALIRGGDPNSEKPWHEGLQATASWADCRKRAEGTLLKCNAAGIDAGADSLDEASCGE